MPTVFISYSSTDRPFVLKLAQDLKDRGFEVWLDVWSITGREPYWYEIQAGIENTDYFLFVITPKSIERGSGAIKEAFHADSLESPPDFVVTMAEDTSMRALPMVLSPGVHQIHNFVALGYAEALRRVLAALNWVEPEPVPPPKSEPEPKPTPPPKSEPKPISKPEPKPISKPERKPIPIPRPQIRFDPRLAAGGLIGLALLMLLGAWQLGLFGGDEGKTPRSGFEPVTRNEDWTPITETIGGMEMVLVPMGCFMMGSQDISNAQPVHEQCFDEPFWIGKYEVTNAEYAQFIVADGYNIADYWTEAGWNWRTSNNISAPIDYDDFTSANHPRVGVSWYEVYAYTQWLSAEGGVDFCLPTEAKWEYAARGPDAWLYPWGDEFIGDNLVYSGNSGGRSAVVGSRPSGASWVGALDMAGSVWEWVLSEYGDYPYLADDGLNNINNAARRGVRGGSWSGNLVSARAAYRLNFLPFNRNSIGGFRVCAAYTTP